jgi:predicted AAA+ superfamily ATPase
VIERRIVRQRIQKALRRARVVALLGSRQCGKTTLARTIVPPESINYFDLEDPSGIVRLEEPMSALRDLKGVVVIDEIQRRPDLFPILRVLSDRRPLPARFLILGSASPELGRHSSESLAGRLEIVSISGFSLSEAGTGSMAKHWRRGGFPPSFLARTEDAGWAWRKNFVLSLLERDLPQYGIRIPAAAILRFWTMLAHYHGQIWNASEAARSLDVDQTTARRYLDLLEGVYMVRTLQPWFANIKKRQVKAPKIYFRDSGLLHYLLGVRTERELLSHPKSGASWEGYAVEEVLKIIEADEAYYWRTHNGAELDLLVIKAGRRLGFECKRTDAPRLTPSMRTALETLDLEKLYVVYPGDRAYPLHDRVDVLPIRLLNTIPLKRLKSRSRHR